jgi:hypothetical protein
MRMLSAQKSYLVEFWFWLQSLRVHIPAGAIVNVTTPRNAPAFQYCGRAASPTVMVMSIGCAMPTRPMLSIVAHPFRWYKPRRAFIGFDYWPVSARTPVRE